MSNTNETSSTSFTTRKINNTTFVVLEDDLYKEQPLIYVKIHPKVPLIILSDTGCDEPSEKHKGGTYSSNYPPRRQLHHARIYNLHVNLFIC